MSEEKSKPDQSTQDFQQKALGKTPTAALSICGVIIALSLSFRIADIEISDGVNRYIAAKARAVELEVESGVNVPKELESRVEAIEGRLKEVEATQQQLKEVQSELKKVAHAPKGTLLYK